MYHKILVPLENTPCDEVILAHVRDLARAHGAELILAHVADGFGARYRKGLNLEDSEEIKQDHAYLERRRAELAAEGLRVRAVLEMGDPASRLLAILAAESCDLIAMATHRHGPFGDFFLGSVAATVRHRTLVPVLLVPAR
ncbi:MAG: universal stress protein [Phycisphaerales bacterium]|nr:universal stress protein [Phycisphaerales bacterium]